MPTNLELKARFPQSRETARILSSMGAKRSGRMKHIDTYFFFKPGRLKLREIDGRRAELIWYQRPNRKHQRFSLFKRIQVQDPRAVKRILAKKLGIRVVVRKQRELFLYRNARIHLDTVKGLGSFIECEVLVTKGKAQARRFLALLKKSLRIQPSSILVSSYSDLLIRSQRRTS